jgi:predicted nucleic acid-binding protein
VRSIVIDAGSIISLSMNCMLPIFKALKSDKIEFTISKTVHKELFDKPINNPKFKYSAMKVEQFISDGTIKIIHSKEVDTKSDEIINYANSVFRARGKDIQIIHKGEAEVFALAKYLKSDIIVNDERVSRTFVESPENLRKKLFSRLHTKVEFNKENYKKAKELTGEPHIIRSADLFAVAFSKGIFDQNIKKVKIKNSRKEFLRGGLWALKFSGCFISNEEIEEYVKMLA